MANLGSLTYDLVANTQKFSNGLSKAERIAKRRSRNIKAAMSGIGLVAAGIAVSMTRMVRSVVQTADQYDKLSVRLGVSTEALSELSFAAELSGIKFNTLTMAMQRSTRRIAEAAQGTGEAKDALRELGLDAGKLNQLAPDKQLEALADAFGEVESSADKVRLSMKLFDSEGVAMLQLIEKQGAGLSKMRDRAAELGLTMNAGTVAAMVELKDTMTEVGAVTEGASRILAASLAPALQTSAQWFATAATWAAKFLDGLRDIKNQTNLEGLQEQLLEAQISINNLSARLATGGSKFRGKAKIVLELEAAKARANELVERLREINTASRSLGPSVDVPNVTGGGLTTSQQTAANAAKAQREQFESLRISLLGEEQQIQESYQRRLEMLMEFQDQKVITDQEFAEVNLTAMLDRDSQLMEIERKNAEERKRLEEQVANVKMNLQRDVVNNAIGLLQLLGQKNKGFAIAAIILQKAMALQEIAVQHAKSMSMLGILEAVAVAQAMAQLGPIAGPPAAAAIHAQFAGLRALATTSAVLGGILEVASGLQQIQNLNSGGSTLAGGVTGVSEVDPVTGFPVGNTRQAATYVTINIGNNKVFSDEAIRELIGQINNQIDDGVVIKGIRVS